MNDTVITSSRNATNRSISTNGTLSIFAGRQAELLTWFTVTGSAAFLGAILNLLALIAAWPQPSKRSSFGLLISHYAGVHFFMCLINIPISVFMVLARSRGYVLAPSTCIPVQFFWGLTITLINWTDAGLAMNRCVALFLPHYYAAWSTKASNIALITFIWTICVVALLIPAFMVGFETVMAMSPITGACGWNPGPAGIYATVNVYMVTITPYVLTGIGSVLILWKSTTITRRSNVVRPGVQGPSAAMQYRLKMARMLLLTYLWTVICNAPLYIVAYCYPWALRGLTVSALWLKVVAPFQYGFTPCILLLSNKEYRSRLERIFHITNNALVRAISNTARSNVSHLNESTNL